jgi:hypothetical protein
VLSQERKQKRKIQDSIESKQKQERKVPSIEKKKLI